VTLAWFIAAIVIVAVLYLGHRLSRFFSNTVSRLFKRR